MKRKWDDMYMKMAEVAASKSHAKKRQVGAIAVKNDNIIGIGINGTPVGWTDNMCEDPYGKTYPFVLHAETNMVSKMAKSSISSNDCTVYCTCAPCLECAKAMYQAGVKRLVFKDHYKDISGVSFLRALGVEVVDFNEK